MKQYVTILCVLFIFQAIFFPGTGTGQTGGTLAVNFSDYPLSLDPETVLTDTEKILLANLHEGLVAWDNGMLIPAAAQRWEVSENGRVYTFHLRESFWSNGDPVTAHDFLSTWQRLLAPDSMFQHGFLFDIIVNAEAYRTGRIDSFAGVGIQAVDDKTLRVELERPAGHFLVLLTLPQFFPVHHRYNTGGTPEEQKDYLPGFCSNGPFRVIEWEPRDYAVFVPNGHYMRERVKLERVKITFLPPTSAVSLYAVGLLDLLENPPSSAFPRHEQDLVQVSSMGTGYIYLNLRRPPIHNPLVREALALAIDRDYIVENILRLNGIPATGLIPPGIPDRTGDDFRKAGGNLLPAMDKEKALALLHRAGYPGEDGLPELDLLVVEGGLSELTARAVAEMWEANLGFTVNLKVVSWLQYNELCTTGRFYTARAGWIGDYPDPLDFLELFFSGSRENFSAYNNPEYDRWLLRAQENLNAVESCQVYHALEEMILKDWPVIPVYFTTKPYLVSPELQELKFSPQGYPLFNTARGKR